MSETGLVFETATSRICEGSLPTSTAVAFISFLTNASLLTIIDGADFNEEEAVDIFSNDPVSDFGMFTR